MMKGKKTQKTIRSYAPHLAAAAFVMVLVTVLALFAPAYAAASQTGNFSEELKKYLSTSAGGDAGTWQISGNSITGRVSYKKAASCVDNDTAQSSNLTITSSAPRDGKISFDYEVVSQGEFVKIGGSTVTGSGNKGLPLPSEGKLEISIKSTAASGGDAEIKITNIAFTVDPVPVVNVTVKCPTYGGTVSVDGELLTEDKVIENIEADETHVVKLSTTETDDKYQFCGWYDGQNELLSEEKTYDHYVKAEVEIHAHYVEKGAAAFSVNNVDYYDLPSAIAASKKTAKPAILKRDYVLPVDTYTIPVGASLLIPYSASDTGTFSSTASSVKDALANPAPYMTLTVPQGAVINVNGALNVNAQQAASSGNYAGSVYGDYGCLKLEEGAYLNFNTGSVGYIYGFIIGQGEVAANNGSKVWELMQLSDWRGGSNSKDLMKSMDSFVCSQYYFQNIESKYTVYSGATSGICFQTTLLKQLASASVPLIGSGEGLLRLEDGAHITRTYHGDEDRVVWDLSGTVSASNLALDVSVIGISVDLDTADKVFPLQGNYTFNIGDGSTMRLTNKFQMLPGCQVNVEKGGKLVSDNGTELYVFDKRDWGKYASGNYVQPVRYAPTKSGNRSASSNLNLPDASLRIDGTFEANGAIYSTSNGKGFSGTGVFINNVSAPKTGLTECTTGTTVVTVSVKPLIGNLAGVSKNAEDYTKAFASGATYYGTPKTVDAQGNILKESAWYQYAINAVAAGGQDLCTGIVPVNGDSMGVYSLGGYYETATFGVNTIDNVVGYVANGNGTTGTFNFKVVGYQVDRITASSGRLTGPDANGVYSLSDITSNVTLTVTTAGDAEQYTLKYLMDDDSYAVYTSHGGTGTGETVEVNGVTYHVIAAPTGSAGSKVTPPTVTIPEGYSFNWQYTSGAVTDGTSINAEEAAASTDRTVYVIGVFRGNTAKNVTTGKEYQTLTEALAAVSSTGAEIQLLNDPGKYYEESGAWAVAPGLTVTLDLNGRTLAGSLANRGTLTLKDGSEAKTGKIVNSTAGTGDAVNKRSYALLNDSGATLTLESGAIQDTGASYSAGVINNCGTIAKIGAVDIRSTSNYAVYNYGGTITTIDGTTITGAYGIWNRNIRKANIPADGTQWTNSYSGTIGTIKDATVTAKTNYALRNAGTIQEISGATEMRCTSTAGGSCVVYNENSFYQDGPVSKRTETSDDKKYTRVDECNAPYPTIGLITEHVQISSEKGRGIYSTGKITTINGSVKISAQNKALYVDGGGVVDTISGNVAISTTADYAVQVSGARAVKNEYEYAEKMSGPLVSQVTTYGESSHIGKITGNVKISAGTNSGIYNSGTIDTISNGVEITVGGSSAITNAADVPQGKVTILNTAKGENTNKGTKKYDTERQHLYEYDGRRAVINCIDSVTVKADNGSAAIYNCGYIGTMDRATLSAKTDTVHNANVGTRTGTRQLVSYYFSATERAQWPGNSDYYFSAVDVAGCEYNLPSQIDTIKNCTITSTGSGAIAIKNAGKIGTISGNTVDAKGAAISNTTASRSAYMDTVEVTGEKGNWSTKAAVSKVTANGAPPEIGTIDANTITSSSGNAIDNRGIITTLGADGLSVTANAGHAVYSADSLKLDSYKTESQTYAGQSCTVVTSIEKSTATTIVTPAEIQTLTTGQYSASSGKYALYNNGSNAISVTAEALSPYSGPEFKSASGTRAYAVYGPDNAAKQTYTSNGDQGTPVTLSAKADGDGWFYLVANTATVVFDPNGGAEMSSSQTIDLSNTSATVNCPTFTKNQHEFLGFAVKADATEADFAINASGELSIAVSALKEKTKAAAGDTITLYAVYKQSYLHTVDWIVTGVDGIKIEQTKIMTAEETVTKSVAGLKLTGNYIIKSCTISPKSGAKQTVELPADNIKLEDITDNITVTLDLVAYDHIVTIKDANGKDLQTQYVSVSGENVTDVLDNSKPVGYKVTGKQLITKATGEKCKATISGDKTKVEVTEITGDATVTVTLVDYQYKVVVKDAGGAVLQAQYVSVSGEKVTDVLDNSKPVGYKVTGKQFIKGVTEANCKATISEDKTTVTVTSINGDATVTLELAAYDHIVTVNATGYSQTYYVKNNGKVDVLTGSAITYTVSGKNVISGVTILPEAAKETHDATTATITNITGNVTVTVALESYDYLVTIEDGGSPETHYVKGNKDVLTNSAITYTAGENQVITGITGGGATFERGEGDVNAEVADGWKSFTLSGIKKDQTVAVTLKDYDWTVNWTLEKQDHGITAKEVSRSYVKNGEAAALSMSGFRATGVTGAGSATVDTSQNGVVTISNITANLAVTVTARNYSYAVTWNVNGTQARTDYLGFDENTATYTAGENTVVISASVTPDDKATVTHTNTKVTVTGISSDVTVHVTTEKPTTDKATYYFGDMSYEYKRNTVLYQWDGKSEDKGQWIPVDSFAWQHKAGSRIYEFEDENLEAIVVPNGSVLLVNGSNQTMQYTVTYTDGYEGAAMTFTAGEKTGSNILSVVLKPGEKIMVSSTFACDVTDKTLTNAPAGQVTVTTEPYNN